MSRTILPRPTVAARRISSAPIPLLRVIRTRQRPQPVPRVALNILGVILLFIAAAAIVSLVSGCGGNVIYTDGMTDEELAPVRDMWEAIGAPAFIYAVPRGSIPNRSDRVRFVRHGQLQADGHGDEGTCGWTPSGGVAVWDGSFETRDIQIDRECLTEHNMTLRTALGHEIAHWMGVVQHLPVGEVGIMAAGAIADGLDHGLTCADKRHWAAFSGGTADCGQTGEVLASGEVQP